MAHIFLSYANEDRELARRVVGLLEKTSLQVWWDRRIPAGMNWNDVLDKALSEMQCMVVLWTHHSVASDWVYEEAEEGRKRGVLLPVLLEDVQPPRGFRSIQCADLSAWDGDPKAAAAQQLLTDLRTLAGIAKEEGDKVSLPPPPQPDLAAPEIETELLTRLRKQMLLSPNSFELRRGLYELESYLKDATTHAHAAEARMLLSQMQTALQRAEAMERPAAAVASPGPSRIGMKPWWLWAGAAAMALLLGTMAVKLLHVKEVKPVPPPALEMGRTGTSPIDHNNVSPAAIPEVKVPETKILEARIAKPAVEAGLTPATPAAAKHVPVAPSTLAKKTSLPSQLKARCSALLERIGLGDEVLSDADRQLLKECGQ